MSPRYRGITCTCRVENCLSGGGTDVNADVVAMRGVRLLDLRLGAFDRLCQGELFFAACIKPSRDMSTRDNQGMAGRHWKSVPESHNNRVGKEQPFKGRVAKRANRLGSIHELFFVFQVHRTGQPYDSCGSTNHAPVLRSIASFGRRDIDADSGRLRAWSELPAHDVAHRPCGVARGQSGACMYATRCHAP